MVRDCGKLHLLRHVLLLLLGILMTICVLPTSDLLMCLVEVPLLVESFLEVPLLVESFLEVPLLARASSWLRVWITHGLIIIM